MVREAPHLSDIHLGPMPRARRLDLFGKRALGLPRDRETARKRVKFPRVKNSAPPRCMIGKHNGTRQFSDGCGMAATRLTNLEATTLGLSLPLRLVAN
jgi:hypothetical protein